MLPENIATTTTRNLVLDTNVCLDLFVFHDPRYLRVLELLQAKQFAAVTFDACRNEYRAVLNYVHLPLDADTRIEAASAFDRFIHVVPTASSIDSNIKLPTCKDKDDQKFLELAWASNACALLTKDKALLKLAKRCRNMGLFAIITPDAWLSTIQPDSAATQSH